MRTTTIKEHGLQLPIGELKDGALHKDLSLRPYKGRVSRALNLYREANEGRSVAYLAAKYLSLVIESAGGVTYPLTAEGDSTSEQEFRLHNWYWADFMYAYIYSRITSVTEWIMLPAACGIPKCGFKGDMKGDLWTCEVTVMDDPKEMFTWITLRDGMKLTTGRVCRRLKIGPVRYRAMLLPGSGEWSITGFNYSQLRESIAEVEDAPEGYVLHDADLEQLSHFDVLRIDRQAGAAAAGVDLRTIVTCPKCGAPIKAGFNWAFDPFFDSSVPLEILTA